MDTEKALTQTAAGTRRGEPSHKVDALDPKQAVEVVVLRHSDLIAVGVLQVRRPLAALLRVVAVDRVCNPITIYH